MSVNCCSTSHLALPCSWIQLKKETATETETRLIATLEESHLNCHYDVLCVLFCCSAGEKDREWGRQTYPATPPLSMWLARVTSSLQTSNCHLRRPRTPQSTLPVCMPIRMSTFMPVASRTCLPEEWERNEEWEIKANDEWGKQWKPQYTGIL